VTNERPVRHPGPARGSTWALYGHSIVQTATDTIPSKSIQPKELQHFFDSLKAVRWLRLDGFVAGSRPEDQAGVLLTLDDGGQDLLTTTLPILERNSIPVLAFISSGFVVQTAVSADRVVQCLAQSGRFLWIDGTEQFIGGKPDGRCRTEKLRLELKCLGSHQRQEAITRLLTLNPQVAPDPHGSLNADELMQVARHKLVEIGGHTTTHPALPYCSLVEIFREIRSDRYWIGRQTGTLPRAFAYPYGAHSFRVRLMARLAGYSWAFSTEERSYRTKYENPHALPRLDLLTAVAASKRGCRWPG